jgi:PAS domain S-box-containing protein
MGQRVTFSAMHVPAGGTHYLLEITYFPLLDGAGDVAGGAVSFRQVGGPNHLGALSNRTYVQFHDVLEKMTDAFVALDGNWCYTYVNRKAAAIFNRAPEYLTGKHIWTEFPEGVGQPFHQAYYRAVAERVTITLEEYYPPYDKWFENRIFPLEDGLAIFFSDVTVRKKEQGQLQASYAAMEASQMQLRRVLDSLFIFAGLFSKTASCCTPTRRRWQWAALPSRMCWESPWLKCLGGPTRLPNGKSCGSVSSRLPGARRYATTPASSIRKASW